MKTKLSDYVANFLADNGIRNVFTVVGGGAMHLNDAFGNHPEIECIYNHHEQGSAICAEGYARINGDLAVTCVTTGPGGTNAITGVLCAWQDSIPMLIISGQTRLATTVESTGLKLRQFGEQEHNIIETVKSITKYAVMVKDPNEIKYHLQKAIHEATSGRCGPCWIDIPLDIQSQLIDEESLLEYRVSSAENDCVQDVKYIIDAISKAKSPVLVAGSAVRTSKSLSTLYKVVEKLNIPTVCPTSICDYYALSDPLYFGNFGVFGGRTGNFIVQNADLIVSLGARMSFKQIGFNYPKFSPNSKKIIVDIDENEMKKDTLKIDYPILNDVNKVLNELDLQLRSPLQKKEKWLDYCNHLKMTFTFDEAYYQSQSSVNAYYFGSRLHKQLPEKMITVVGNSCASVSMLQMGIDKKGQRIFGNVNCGTMGYDIPAAIGAAVAAKESVLCITGDGSFQMNIQELQTIVYNRIPVKFVVFNNGGYSAIVQSQSNFFNGRLSGCTKQSGLSMPSFEKISYAYDIPYRKVSDHGHVDQAIAWLLNEPAFALLEVIQDINQQIEPKVMSKKLEDGTLYSPPIDDLSPFLSEEAYHEFSKF